MGVWLTGIIILLIVGILLDGWRRMRQGRQTGLKMGAGAYHSPTEPPVDDYSSELPNGGARVVDYRRTEPSIGAAPQWTMDDEAETTPAATDSPHDEAPQPVIDTPLEPEYKATPEEPIQAEPEPRIPQQVTLNLDESVPMLMESVPQNEQEAPPLSTEPPAPDLTEPKPAAPRQEAVPERETPSPVLATPTTQAPSTASPPPGETTQATTKTDPEEVLIINVMAPTGSYFQGEALQQAIFDQGLRYGNMSIFHRYRDARGGGPIQFSLANMVKPGTFDLDAMSSFQTPGVSLFMTLPLEGDNVAAFDLMLDTAKTLAETLGGELKDENRSVMTRQTMEHDRQRVLDFVRRQLSRVPG